MRLQLICTASKALQDCELLGLKPSHGLPQEFIWQYISVPPVCIRPSVQQDGASNEDDLTVKLTEIVFTNALIKQGLAKGVSTAQLMVCRLHCCTRLVSPSYRNNGNFCKFQWRCTLIAKPQESLCKW